MIGRPSRRWRPCPLLAATCLCLLAACWPTAARADGAFPERYLLTIHSASSPAGQFDLPTAAVLAPDGSLYVADNANHRVQQLSASGQVLAVWGQQGGAQGQFDRPSDLALAPDGGLYVLDRGNQRVQHVAAAGRFLASWGGPGSGPGALHDPRGLAVAPDGSLWLADSGNHRLQHWSAAGVYLGALGQEGTGSGQLRQPYDLAVGAGGDLWIADTGNRRVQHWSAEGQVLGSWSTAEATSPTHEGPWGIALDAAGRIGVLETSYDLGSVRGTVRLWLKRYTATGVLEDTVALDEATLIGEPHPGRGLNWQGNAWLVAFPEAGQVLRCDSQGRVVQRFGSRGEGPGVFYDPRNVAIRADGQLAVSDAGRDAVHWLSPVAALGQPNRYHLLTEDLLYPAGLAYAPDGTCLVVDEGLGPLGGPRVQRFDRTGEFVAAWGEWGGNEGDLWAPVGLDVSDKGLVYVADAGLAGVSVYDAGGAYRGGWGKYGSGDGALDNPGDLALAPDGTCYVSDRGNQRVQRFDADGDFLAAFGSVGSGMGQFADPVGLAVDASGRVYVADPGNARVTAFSASGQPLHQWQALPVGAASLVAPYDVALDGQGMLVLVDRERRCLHLWGQQRPSGWYAQWYDNNWLAGVPLTTTFEPHLAYDWGDEAPLSGLPLSGLPGAGLPADGFSVRWQRTLDWSAGTYVFTLAADDTVRLWVGKRLLIEASSPAHATRSAAITLPGGEQVLCLEYRDQAGAAQVALDWAPLTLASKLWLPWVASRQR
jgi:DNA-binding beta-propeller fold protein YncE